MAEEKATPAPATKADATPAKVEGKILTTKELFSDEAIRAKFTDMLGKRAPGFIVSVLQCVASNAMLKQADPNSVYNAAAVAATLDLPLNNQLGFAYIVPYNVNEKVAGPGGSTSWQTRVVAQFQVGYKGFIQLAQRTGQYRKIAATRVMTGQLIKEDPLLGYEFDFTVKAEGATVIGYASRFELINGFEKTVYWTIDELQKHGKKFSKSYGKAGSIWDNDAEAMYLKTVLKANLSKFGPMSIDLQRAVITDQAMISDAETLDAKYVDAPETTEDKERERITLLIAQAKTIEDLDQVRKFADLDQSFEIARKEIEILAAARDKSQAAGHTQEVETYSNRIKALEELIA
jgi:recombination protein RecT